MSEHFLLPSARQILAFNDSDFFDENIPSFFRFHTGRCFIWIELTNSLYNIYVRGYYYNEWISTKKLLVSYNRLYEAINGYFSLVRRLMDDLYT